MPQGGRRPGSGRPSLLEEKTKITILRLCATRLLQALRAPDSEVSKRDKAHISLELVKRSYPLITEEIGNVSKNVIFNITKNHVPNHGSTEVKPEPRVQPLLHTETDSSA